MPVFNNDGGSHALKQNTSWEAGLVCSSFFFFLRVKFDGQTLIQGVFSCFIFENKVYLR